MHEIGIDDSYTESWRRIADGSGKFLVVRVKRSGRLLHSLVVVGNRFVYVRNRAKDLPRASSLEAYIESTKATRDEIIEYVDCEFSVGRVQGGSVPWEIQQSTLPWREGHHLDFVDLLTVSDGGEALVPRALDDDQWTVPVNTLSSRNINALFGNPTGAAGEDATKNPLVGTWILVKYVDTPENSEPIFAFGKEPIGHFIFTPGGHVAFSIMRNPPDIDNPTSDPDPDACIPGWYCAYFGTYTVDVKNGVWVTHVQSANIPGFLNTDQPRHFTINGDTLMVSETYSSASTRIKAERVFVREAFRGLRNNRIPSTK
jgi:hypothetical protein